MGCCSQLMIMSSTPAEAAVSLLERNPDRSEDLTFHTMIHMLPGASMWSAIAVVHNAGKTMVVANAHDLGEPLLMYHRLNMIVEARHAGRQLGTYIGYSPIRLICGMHTDISCYISRAWSYTKSTPDKTKPHLYRHGW